MAKFAFIIMLALLAPTRMLLAQELVDEIDLEVVRLLSLDQEQAVAYSAIMQRQRVAFSSLKSSRWEQQKVFYEETFNMLKPVLTEEQYIRFVGYIDSFIEMEQDEDFMGMNEDFVGMK